MAWFIARDITIAGIAAAVPKNTVEAVSCIDRFDKKAIEKFVNSTGIACIHKTIPEQTASDLGFAAANNLLKKTNVERSKIGVLVFVTLSPDYKKPPTACVLQKRLELSEDCACMDVGHGCGGFVYGNETIEALMMASDCEYGLLVLGETTSKVTSKYDIDSLMFADAGAAILYKKAAGYSHVTLLRSDGNRFKSLIVPSGGFRDPYPKSFEYIASDGTTRSKYDIYMDGTDVFLFSITDVPRAIDDYLARTGNSISDYDAVAFHQANSYILQRLIRKYKLERDRVPFCLDRYGNTSSVSIPLALCDYYGNQQIDSAQKVLACGFGVGLAWGVTSLEINPLYVYPITETDDYFEEGRLYDGDGINE